jgi:hypothetical protein
MRQTILKITEGLAYLSLDLIYNLKGKYQKTFRENVFLSTSVEQLVEVVQPSVQHWQRRTGSRPSADQHVAILKCSW